jgi:hypothetical protein
VGTIRGVVLRQMRAAGGQGSLRSRVVAVLLVLGLLALSAPVLVPAAAWVWDALT